MVVRVSVGKHLQKLIHQSALPTLFLDIRFYTLSHFALPWSALFLLNRLLFLLYHVDKIAGFRLHSTENFAVFPHLLFVDNRSDAFCAPAVFGIRNTPKTGFILEKQPYFAFFLWITRFQLFDFRVNFFEASQVASSAALGCRPRGTTLRQLFRSNIR